MRLLLILAVLAAVAACGDAGGEPAPPTATPSQEREATPAPAATAVPAAEARPTATATPAGTATPTLRPTATPLPTPSVTFDACAPDEREAIKEAWGIFDRFDAADLQLDLMVKELRADRVVWTLEPWRQDFDQERRGLVRVAKALRALDDAPARVTTVRIAKDLEKAAERFQWFLERDGEDVTWFLEQALERMRRARVEINVMRGQIRNACS